jgi:hypothetical protein
MTKRTKHMRKLGGRPRKIGVPREPSGKVERKFATQLAAESATKTAREARMRIYGVTKQNAIQPTAATVIGRMFLAGKLTAEQRDVADKYLALRNGYHRAMGAVPDYVEPPPSEDPEIEAPKEDATGDSRMTFDEFCLVARDRYDKMQGSLQALAQEVRSPAPLSALDIFVVRDIHMAELEGDLRLALNCLHRHFVQGERKIGGQPRIRAWKAA